MNTAVTVAENTTMPAASASSPADVILHTIANAAANPAVDVEKMKALLDMQKDIMAVQAKADFNAAMSSCQAEMQRVMLRHENKETRSKYAKLDDVDTVGRPVYTKHGFSLTFSSTETETGFVTMECTIMHRGGHEKVLTKCGWRDDTGPKGGATKTRIQGSGSTGTYLRKALTCEAFNIVTTEMVQADTDGNGAIQYISTVQRDIILEKLDRAGKTATQLCQSLKIETLGEIPATWFDSVIAKLNQKTAA